MPLINPTLPNNGENADAPDVNVPFQAILNLINGNLDADNFNLTGPFPVASLVTDTISEDTTGAGVTIDGVLLKDGKIGPGVLPPTYVYFQGPDLATSGTGYTKQYGTRTSIDFDKLLRGATAAYFVGRGSAESNANTDQSRAKLVITNGSMSDTITDITDANISLTNPYASVGTSADILANLPTGVNLVEIATNCSGLGAHSGVGTIQGTHLRIEH